MIYYFCGSNDKPDLQINVEGFFNKLSAFGHDLYYEEQLSQNEQVDFYWRIDTPRVGGRLEGRIHTTQKVIRVDGEIDDVAAFTLWLRSYIPKDSALNIWNDDGSHLVTVTSQTSLNDIKDTIKSD